MDTKQKNASGEEKTKQFFEAVGEDMFFHSWDETNALKRGERELVELLK